MLLREKLVQAELAAARLGIREVGGNNHGPWVKKFLAEVGLPEGYAWCDAFQSYEEHAVAGKRLPIESAGVYETFLKARSLGWLVPVTGTPARGDLVLYDFDGDGQTDDHIGCVTGVTALLGAWKLNTVEGNTGDGSAADGDGVYVRTRIVKRSSVAFVRIPGVVPDPPKPVAVVLHSPTTTTTSSSGSNVTVTFKPVPPAVVKKPKPSPVKPKPAPKKKPEVSAVPPDLRPKKKAAPKKPVAPKKPAPKKPSGKNKPA